MEIRVNPTSSWKEFWQRIKYMFVALTLFFIFCGIFVALCYYLTQ